MGLRASHTHLHTYHAVEYVAGLERRRRDGGTHSGDLYRTMNTDGHVMPQTDGTCRDKLQVLNISLLLSASLGEGRFELGAQQEKCLM